jgi:hypothetical protein
MNWYLMVPLHMYLVLMKRVNLKTALLPIEGLIVFNYFLIKTDTISLMSFGVQRVWVLRYLLLVCNSLIFNKR